MSLKHSSPMSEKKSWDVVRSAPARKQEPVVRKATPPPVRRRTQSVRTPEHPVVATRTRTRVSHEPLRVRRARAKRFFYIGVAVFVVLSLAALIYAAWLPALRISSVVVSGPDAESIKAIAQEHLSGTHLFVVPRNSLFFIPEGKMRKAILAAHPNIVAVSFASNGLQSITVVPVERTPAFLWCGESKETARESCYSTDADGLVFAPYMSATPLASSTLLLKVYVPLEGGAYEPVRAHVGYASMLPHALLLAKTFRALGADSAELVIRNDEADFYTSGGTRITYVLGKEDAAAQLAASVFPKLSLNDGSVEYVDLRFESKVYLRKEPTGTDTDPAPL